MTLRVKITHDEPTSTRELYVGLLVDIAGYDQPQMQNTTRVKPGESAVLHVHGGAEIRVWEAPTELELKVADEIELAMNHSKRVPAPKLDPRVRLHVARAAIAAARWKSA